MVAPLLPHGRRDTVPEQDALTSRYVYGNLKPVFSETQIIAGGARLIDRDDPSATEPTIRMASMSDVSAIIELLQPYVQTRQVLPRTEQEVARLIPNGFVVESEGTVIGFAAVEVYSLKMAEIQCLAVAEPWQRRGFGKQLVSHCVERARELGVYELMAITASENLFNHCGFSFSLPDQKKAMFIQLYERNRM